MRFTKGSTLVEVLVASVIFAIGVAGSVSSVVFAFNLVLDGRYGSAMDVIAHSELERAKVWGFSNLPCGTYVAATSTGTWTGSFDKTQNNGMGAWVAGAKTGYDVSGAQVTTTNAAIAFQVSTTIHDAGNNQVLPVVTGPGYTLDNYATRQVTVTVTCLTPTGGSESVSTILVKGGI